MPEGRGGWVLLCRMGKGRKEEVNISSLGVALPRAHINWVVGRSVDGIVFRLLFLWKVGVPREHPVSQEDPGTQTYRPFSPNSAATGFVQIQWQDVAKGERNFEFPFSLYMPEGTIQGSLSIRGRIARWLKRSTWKYFNNVKYDLSYCSPIKSSEV